MGTPNKTIGAPLVVIAFLVALPLASAQSNGHTHIDSGHTPNENDHTSNETVVVTLTKFEGHDCTGPLISNKTFPVGQCLTNTSLDAIGSFEYQCHQVVRPTCAFLRVNCTNDNSTNGRVEEFPCDICSVSGIFRHPTVYNFTYSSSLQKLTFNTNCINGCGSCNQSMTMTPGECMPHGQGLPWELIRVGPCLDKVMTVSFTEENCSGKRQITGLIASGQCDERRSETRVCHTV